MALILYIQIETEKQLQTNIKSKCYRELVYFDITKYHNEVDLYIKLWKIKFNIEMLEEEVDFNHEIMQLIIS